MSFKQDYDTARQVTEQMGYESNESFIEQTKNNLNSMDKGAYKRGLDDVSNFAKGLTELILLQVIESDHPVTKEAEFANQFDDGWLKHGNTKQYINTLATGNVTFDDVSDKFIPDHKTPGHSEAAEIKMYEFNGRKPVLTPNSYQFCKNYTIEEHQLIPYFKEGNLMAYINQIRAQMTKSWELFKFSKVVNYIMSESKTFQKQINGKGTDMYESIIEFLEHITMIQLLNSEYNIGDKTKTQDIRSTNVDDLIIIMHPKNLTRLNTGILTQLFNAKLMNVDGALNTSKITVLPNQITIGTENTPIDVLTDAYVDENTIIVFDKRALKFLYQLQQTDSQKFVQNMTNQVVMHVWFTMGMLPWYQGFVYKNKNLSKLPSKP